MATGRTVNKWIRFGVSGSDGTAREIPIDSIGPFGITYDEVELTAWQEAIKGYLSNHGDAPVDITGPWDNRVAAALAASGLAPVLSGSHTILSGIVGGVLPRGLWIAIGVRGYWTAATDPAWGVAAPSATSGYLCTKYNVEGEKYSARFVVYPGTTPAWGTAILADYA